MDSNTIVAIVSGAVIVIIAFSLWPVLNEASNSLYMHFRGACVDEEGNRFLRVYLIDETTEIFPNDPDPNTYYRIPGKYGGSGIKLTGIGLWCGGHTHGVARGLIARVTSENLDITSALYIRVFPTPSPHGFDIVAIPSVPLWVEPAPMLQRFSGINSLLLSLIPVVSIAGFLGISGAKLYSYGRGAEGMSSSISSLMFTLAGIVIAVVIFEPVLGSILDANQVVVSGQYQVNSTFGNIISLLFAMIPTIYIAGLIALVGLQARSTLLGSQKQAAGLGG